MQAQMGTYFCILHAGYKNVHVLTCTPRKSGASPSSPLEIGP